jgi:hypothetical protein
MSLIECLSQLKPNTLMNKFRGKIYYGHKSQIKKLDGP